MERIFVSDEISYSMKHMHHNLHYHIEGYKAFNVLQWQFVKQNDYVFTHNYNESTYKIVTVEDYVDFPRTIDNRCYIIFKSRLDFCDAINRLRPNKIMWSRFSDNGYEVTSRGDRRFSPFFMKKKDKDSKYFTITLENWFKRYIQPLSDEEKKGTAHKLFGEYLEEHLGLFYELIRIGQDSVLTDMFDVNGGQNKTYCDLCNKIIEPLKSGF